MGAMPCAATYSVVFKKLSSRYGVMTLTALQALVGTLFFAPFAFLPLACRLGLAGHGGHRLPRRLRDARRLPALQLVGDPGEGDLAAAYVNLIPVFTLLLAYLLLGRPSVPCNGLPAPPCWPASGWASCPPGKAVCSHHHGGMSRRRWATVWTGGSIPAAKEPHHERHDLAGRGQSTAEPPPLPWPMPGRWRRWRRPWGRRGSASPSCGRRPSRRPTRRPGTICLGDG